MKEQLEKALWERVKSTYPSGTSKHTNALLEEDFNNFIEHVLDLFVMSDFEKRSEQFQCEKCGSDWGEIRHKCFSCNHEFGDL